MVDEDKDFFKLKRVKKELCKYFKMLIWICENYDEVFYYIYRVIVLKYIVYEGVIVFYFDFYFDFIVFVKMKGCIVFE